MPKVGNRHFPYTAKGKAAAKAAAKKGGYSLGGMSKADTSAKGKKGLLDEKKRNGKAKGKPAAIIIALNKGGKVGKRKR
jgi:hypothetical protein